MEIVQIRHEHIASFCDCVNAVARERKFLATVKGFEFEAAQRFVEENLAAGNPHFVALDGPQVVGWCDVVRGTGEGFEHRGRLGIGVLPGYRGQGLGRRLMEQALAAAEEVGLERVELDVYASNDRAVRLYRAFGFVEEGRKRRARKLDGQHDDILIMARLRD